MLDVLKTRKWAYPNNKEVIAEKVNVIHDVTISWMRKKEQRPTLTYIYLWRRKVARR